MSNAPGMIEYSPEPVVGSIMTRTTPEGVTLAVAPSARRIVWALLWPAISFSLSVGIGLWIYATSGGRLGFLTFPSIFAVLSIWGGVSQAWSHLFPIEFTATPGELRARWRGLSQIRTILLARGQIQMLCAKRLRAKQGLFRRWGLVVQMTAGGEFTLFAAKREEAEFLARKLSEGLKIQETCQAALNLVQPRGCHYRRFRWGDGVAVIVWPRFERQILIVLTLLCIAGAVAGGVALWRSASDDLLYPRTWGRALATAVLMAFLAVIAWYGAFQLMRRMRRSVVLLATPTTVSVQETGIYRPMEVAWKAEQVQSIAVADAQNEKRAIHIVPVGGSPLITAQGEPREHLEWVVQVLNAALTAAKSEETPVANAGPLQT